MGATLYDYRAIVEREGLPLPDLGGEEEPPTQPDQPDDLRGRGH